MLSVKNLLQGVLRALLGRGAGAAGQLLVTFALGWLFGADGSGSLMLGLTCMMVVTLFGRQGLDYAVLRITSQAWGRDDRPRFWAAVSDTSRHALWVSVALGVLFAAATPLLATTVFADPALWTILPIMACAIPCYVLLSLWSEAHKAIDRPGMGNFLHTAVTPAGFVVGLGLLKLAGAESLTLAALAYLAGVLLATLLAGLSLRRHAGPIARGEASELPEMRKIGLPLLFFGLFTMAGSWLPLVVLGVWSNPDEVGQFSAASRLAILIMFILLAFNSVTPARFARLHAEGDAVGISRLARNTSTMMTLVALPLAIGMMLFGHHLLGIMGADFVPAAPALAILAGGQLVNVATGSVSYILIMTGHETQLRRAGTLGFIVNAVGCCILVPLWGVIGAAIAAALAISTENLSATYLAYREAGVLTLPIPMRRGKPRLSTQVPMPGESHV